MEPAANEHAVLSDYHGARGAAEHGLASLKLDIKGFFLLAAVEDCKYPAELAKRCIMPKPTVTFMIKKLEKAGYVKRKTVKGDLRKFELVLTPHGHKAIEKGQVIVSKAFDVSLGALTVKERTNYAALLKKMSVV
jgi:DNA-binding MarR family transcriptional regulator